MPPILAVTPNPSIDKTVVVPGFQLGAIHRPQRLVAMAGGKGLNVARAIAGLGGQVKACVLLAGHAGRWIAQELEREGIEAGITWTDGESRTCLSILEPATQTITEIYESGAAVNEADWRRFEALVGEMLAGVELAVFSGSLPPQAPSDGYARLIRLARERSVKVLLDTHGEALRAALAAGPLLVKVNSAEAGEIVQRPVKQIAEATHAANQLRALGADAVVITLGERGAVAVNGQGIWHAAAPRVPAVSPVGSGDALLGGLAVALQRGQALAEALSLGVAAGAANALTLGAGVLEASAVGDLLDQVELERLAAT